MGCLKNTEIMDDLGGERLITDAFDLYILGQETAQAANLFIEASFLLENNYY